MSKTFFRQFPDDDACLSYLMTTYYGKTLDCPKCGKHGKFHRVTGQPAYECAWCGLHIHPMANTIFHRSHTSLQKWFYAIYMFTTTRHGVAAKELQRQLSVTYKTAWRMAHQIRKLMADADGELPLGGSVEADETYVGGKRKGGKRGRGAPGKTGCVRYAGAGRRHYDQGSYQRSQKDVAADHQRERGKRCHGPHG